MQGQTDKQLLKATKLELVAYIRELEGDNEAHLATISSLEGINVMQPLDSEGNVYDTTQPSITQPSHDLVNTKRKTSMVIGDTTNHTGLYNF